MFIFSLAAEALLNETLTEVLQNTKAAVRPESARPRPADDLHELTLIPECQDSKMPLTPHKCVNRGVLWVGESV